MAADRVTARYCTKEHGVVESSIKNELWGISSYVLHVQLCFVDLCHAMITRSLLPSSQGVLIIF